MRVFDKRVLRRVFGRKRDDVTGEWRKLHSEELYDLYTSHFFFRLVFCKNFLCEVHPFSYIFCTLCLLFSSSLLQIFLKNSLACTFLHECFSGLLSLSFLLIQNCAIFCELLRYSNIFSV